ARSLVVDRRPVAPLGLLLALPALVTEAAGAGAGGRPRRPPRPRGLGGPLEERLELAVGVGEVAALIAGADAGDHQLLIVGEEAAGDPAEAAVGGDVEALDVGEGDPELDLGGDLVDVLPAGPGGADGPPAHRRGGDAEAERRELDRRQHAPLIAHPGPAWP